MGKKLMFLVLDSETATYDFANEIANGDSEKKKSIAIAFPLIYDIGWTLVDRMGKIYDRKQFLIAETFSVPSIFNTAYYKEKRPLYLEMLRKGETTIKPWNEVMDILIEDMNKVNAVGAFNSMFDYKRAIPQMELYIEKLYSPDYYEWREKQYNKCVKIANGSQLPKNPNFDGNIFNFRGKEYPLFCLWGLATTHLLNNATYKNKCLEYGMLTQSGTFFKTSAETSYRYLCDKYDFIESHTALDDAIIESYILSKIAKRHAITPGIKFFPFRDLGYTDEFAMRRKVPNRTECEKVYDAIAAYVDMKIDEAEGEISNYAKGLIKKLQRLADYAGFECSYN